MKNSKIDEPIKNLAALAVLIAGFVFTYFTGRLTLWILWDLELIELPYKDETIFAITLALGVPWLLAQLAVMKYARKIKNELF